MRKKNSSLQITGIKENNLKDINLNIEHNQLIAITGLSGSGKSTLAFDTIYAEGQRRYLKTFSPYIRHCLLYTSPSPRDKRQSRMPSSA